MRTILVVAALLAGGCVGRTAAEDRVEVTSEDVRDDARVALADAGGRNVASAELDAESGGVRVRLATTAMAPGTYGAHVHMIGRCDAPDFASAGAHWNPTGAQHGRDNPAGAHLGDLPNLLVGTDGRGSVELLVAGANLGSGPRGMLDADGSALVIHAAADDYRTDPSGNSGARIACGLVR